MECDKRRTGSQTETTNTNFIFKKKYIRWENTGFCKKSVRKRVR